ncbi:MAG: hypothetical protein FRX48_06612 [Lasallia pustulata]|uniref:Uncharacterized protein n=1 Tax=Lasallia pustulata TaxID=136370 RepID=A0A5M8PMA2_9LECA|nr:MAG: hypothetical protein FRX48_06612 [Lasallia pustulata]
MQPQIPGFYYDEEKKKYFNIMAYHIAPQGAKYSQDEVRMEREVEKKRKRTAEFSQRQLRARIQHSSILKHPLGGVAALNREVGYGMQSKSDLQTRVWASGLEPKVLLGEAALSTQITAFAMDPSTRGIVTGLSGGIDVVHQLRSWVKHKMPCGLSMYHENHSRTLTHNLGSQITSINISPSRVLLATTQGAATSPCIYLTKFIEPQTSWSEMSAIPTWPWLDAGVSILLRPTSQVTLWASAAQPSSSPTSTKFAIGTSSSIMLVDEAQGSWSADEVCASATDILAVDWLDENVVVAGGRDGTVRLWDARSRGKTTRLQFPSCISQVKAINGSRVVVAGLQDNLHLYDLRFASSPRRTMHGLISRSRDRPSSSSRTTRMLSQTPTNPYLSYPDYTNSSQPFLGFDVSENRGLVAAATEDCTVRMYGLWTGKSMHVGDKSHHISPNKTYSIGPRGLICGVGVSRCGKVRTTHVERGTSKKMIRGQNRLTTTVSSIANRHPTPAPQSPLRDERVDPDRPPICIPGGIGPRIVVIPEACVREPGDGPLGAGDLPLDLDLLRPIPAPGPPRAPCIPAPPPETGGPPRRLNGRGPTGPVPGLVLPQYMLLCLPLPRPLPSACLLAPRVLSPCLLCPPLLPLRILSPRRLPPPAPLRGPGGGSKSVMPDSTGGRRDRDPIPEAIPGGRPIRGGASVISPYEPPVRQGPGGPPYGIWSLYLRFETSPSQKHMVGCEVFVMERKEEVWDFEP